MTSVPEGRRLFREAVDLAIRLQDDPANPALAAGIRAWVARGPGHRAAWAQVAAIHGMTGTLLAEQGRASLSRRHLILGAAAGLGAAALGSAQVSHLLLAAKADHLTGRGDTRRIGLADGSTVVLGPDSALAVRLDGPRRQADLLQGMAFFDVADRPRQPFALRAGGAWISGRSMGVDVSLNAGFLSVAVGRGRVRVGAGHATGLLEAGEWLTLAPDAALSARGRRDPAQIAAWRQGMLVVEEETVAALIARIARWHRGRVLIADRALGRRMVSGVFDLDDPLAALRAAVQPFGGRVRQVGPFLTVISLA